MYAYPITDSELTEHPELYQVKNILIRHKKHVIGIYEVVTIETVVRPELNAYGYPTRSSRHKADTKYLLFRLCVCMPDAIKADLKEFTPILGKGIEE